MSSVPPDRPDRPRNPAIPPDEIVPPDPVLPPPPEETYVYEERHVEGDPVVPPPPIGADPDVEYGAVHEEERVSVLPDGSVLREHDRYEQRATFRDRLPWYLLALLLLLIIAGGILWWLTRSDSRQVPQVVGLRVDAAVSKLQDRGFKTELARKSSGRPAGVVFGQNPASGTSHDKGSIVRLLVSKGAARKPVPNGVGLAQSAARDRLVQAGFKVTTVQVFSTQPAGNVVSESPAAGTQVAPGSLVQLRVSKGKATKVVPNAVGLSQAAARDRLVAAGFTVMTAQVFSDQPTGKVVSQTPAAGGQAAGGSVVHLNVSKGSSTANVPSEVGNPIDQARSDLASLGFKTTVMRVPSTQPVDSVVAQSPTGGKAQKGSTVQLNVSKGAPATTPKTTTQTRTATQTQTQTQTQTATQTQTQTQVRTQTTTTARTTTVTQPAQTTTVTTPSTSTTSTVAGG
jgi:beta-lactam-binding protein with PASTA domain